MPSSCDLPFSRYGRCKVGHVTSWSVQCRKTWNWRGGPRKSCLARRTTTESTIRDLGYAVVKALPWKPIPGDLASQSTNVSPPSTQGTWYIVFGLKVMAKLVNWVTHVQGQGPRSHMVLKTRSGCWTCRDTSHTPQIESRSFLRDFQIGCAQAGPRDDATFGGGTIDTRPTRITCV